MACFNCNVLRLCNFHFMWATAISSVSFRYVIYALLNEIRVKFHYISITYSQFYKHFICCANERGSVVVDHISI